MGEEGATRKSSRTSNATEKRKAADEGSEEQMKKKLKGLEDQIKKLVGTNTALTDTVKALQKEKTSTRHHTDNNGGSSEDDSDEDNSPMLFAARKITVTSRSNPDAARQQKRRPQGNKANEGDPQPQHRDPPPQRQDALPQHQDPDPLPSPIPSDTDAPECDNSPVGVHSPAPPSQLSNPPLSSSRGAPLSESSKSTVLPAHPWPPAPLAPGVDPKAPRTANKVYDSVVAGMLTEAQHRFECLLFVEDAYPSIDMQIRWSIECWEMVCSESRRYFELSKEMMNLIKGRCSHGRGVILQRVHPIVDGLFNMNTKSKSVVRKNAALAKKLLTNNAFYFVDQTQGKRRFENETILRALQRAFFGGSKSCAAINREKFDPIPLASIALACTIIEHCLREWESGIQIQVNLDETADTPRYRTHMANAVTWKNLNENKTTQIRQHLSGRLFNSCGSKCKPVETTGSIPQKTLDQEKEMLAEWSYTYDTEEEI